MDIPLSERRQIENEMIFRRQNEKVTDELEALEVQFTKEDRPDLANTDDVPLHFKCECSDENCDARIPIKLSVYQKIHENRKKFIVKPNHQVEDIEKVVQTENDYNVVEKYNSTAEPGDKLNPTSVDNS